jgi:hypothetical protein
MQESAFGPEHKGHEAVQRRNVYAEKVREWRCSAPGLLVKQGGLKALLAHKVAQVLAVFYINILQGGGSVRDSPFLQCGGSGADLLMSRALQVGRSGSAFGVIPFSS